MQLGNLELVETDPATQLRAAVAINAAAYLDLLMPESLAAGRTNRCRLKALSIVSVENVGWEVWLFNRRTVGAEISPQDSDYIGHWGFVPGDAVRIAGAGLFYYYVDGLDIPYQTDDVLSDGRPDEKDARRYLHLAVIARTTAKSVNDAGNVKLRFWFEPTLGW